MTLRRKIFVKDPDSITTYHWDWTIFIGTRTITSHVLKIPAGLVIVSQSISNNVVYVQLSGGTLGQVYDCTCHIVMSGGDERDSSFAISIVQE